MPQDFRADVNGLRAYAVLLVMFFHFHFSGFSGGFIGVDVFFVISGYLMTRILFKGLNRGAQGWVWLWEFYLARARRILPALLALCIFLLCFGWLILPSVDYKQLAKHILPAVTFLSNLVFWSEAGYFDVDSHEKWLLHTWSLSVEWQFYIVFPIFLMFVWRFFPGRRQLSITLIFVLLLSFSFSIYSAARQPTAAFYFLHSRAWEMLFGALVFLLADDWKLKEGFSRVIEVAGLALIFVSVIAFDKDSSWPGLYALAPVTGAALVLVAARKNSIWMNLSPIQAIGNWSYSIYLWHWPLAVVLVYLELAGDFLPALAAVAASILLGWLSFKLVEKPARQRLAKRHSWAQTAAVSIVVLSVAVPALSVYIADGIPGRLSETVERLAMEANNFNHYRRRECHVQGGYNFKSCVHGGDNIRMILLGDSHASSVATAVQSALHNTDDGVLTYTYTSCPTIFDVKNRGRNDLKCAEFNEWVEEQVANISSDIPLIIVNRTSAYIMGSHQVGNLRYGKPSVYFESSAEFSIEADRFEFAKRLTKSACRFAKKRPVFLVRPIPEMPADVPKLSSRKMIFGKPVDIALGVAEYHKRHELVWKAQDRAHELCGVQILNPLAWLCDQNQCQGVDNGRSLYYDSHHLSEHGNKRLVPIFKEVLRVDAEENRWGI